MTLRVALKSTAEFIACILVCHLAGFIGSIFTASSVGGWYQTIEKPSFTPPSWLFAPVWLSLYTLMGIALFLVWRKRDVASKAGIALKFFAIQLVLNAVWSPAFFGMRSPEAGLVVIALLLPAVAASAILFYRVSAVAGWLLFPYLAWTLFATVLNASIVAINRQGV